MYTLQIKSILQYTYCCIHVLIIYVCIYMHKFQSQGILTYLDSQNLIVYTFQDHLLMSACNLYLLHEVLLHIATINIW